MSAEDIDDQLARRIYEIVRVYVRRRTEDRAGIPFDVFRSNGNAAQTQKYLESNEKVCKDVFLAMRSRRDEDFIEYFTGTICSVPHYLPQSEYLELSRAIMTDWQKVKTLAMLAVSAHSGLQKPSKKKGNKA